MKRVLSSIAALILAGVSFVSCGGSSKKTTSSGFGFRAFVSNPLHPAGGSNFPVLSIVDAAKDSYTGFSVDLSGTSTFPGLMVLTPNLKNTLVFSTTGNTIAVVDNASESIAQSSTAKLPAISLLGPTESMSVWIDNSTAFVAVPDAPVAGHPTPGAVEVLSFLSGSTSPAAIIPIASAHYIVQSHNGNRILVLSDDPQNSQDSPPECPTQQCITMISPSLLGSEPRTAIPSSAFDHPVWGVFSGDDSKAYIFNCGPECGGAAASIAVLDFTQDPPAVTATVSVPAATYGLLSGTTLYVAGTPSGTPCPSGTAATTCGELTMVDTGSLTVTASATITDGTHDRMALSANGQLFIGAKTCTNINNPASGSDPGEVRGCLSIFNTTNSNVVIPPDLGDVTGIEPITSRHVVYVCQNGRLRIYDTTTDQRQTLQVAIVGQAIDVKLVDPPGNFN